MSDDHEKALGHKIAAHRRRRGLSQKEFAGLLDRSEAWVAQVERGAHRTDRTAVLEKIADVLGVPAAELAAEASAVAPVADGTPAVSARLRLLLSTAHSLRAILARPEPPDTAELRRDADRAWALVHEGAYAHLSDLLERLVPALESATRRAPATERPELFRLLTVTYHACSAALANMGEPEAAWIAADRAVTAADHAGDPVLMAAGSFRLSLVLLGARHYDQADRAAGSAADALRELAEPGDLEAVALRGALTLQRAVAAARTDRADAAYQFLRDAREMAERVGEGRDDHNTGFGPADVRLHEVAVAIDLGDAGTALRTARTIDASALSAERQTRFHLDVARAHAQRRQVDEAVTSLTTARHLSPELVHALPRVKHLVADLLTMTPPPSEALRTLAADLGIPEMRPATRP